MKPTSAGGKPDFIAAGVAGLSAAGISPKEQANWEKKLKEAGADIIINKIDDIVKSIELNIYN